MRHHLLRRHTRRKRILKINQLPRPENFLASDTDPSPLKDDLETLPQQYMRNIMFHTCTLTRNVII